MCFGSSSTPPPEPTPPPPPPSKMDEGAAGREAARQQIRDAQRSGFQSTIATSPTGLSSKATTSQKSLLGA